MQFVSNEVVSLAVNSEMDLKDVADSESEPSEDATEAKMSPAEQVEQEVDSSEALNAPAPLEDDVSVERDEFVNQASQVHIMSRRVLLVVITAHTF